MGAYYRIVNIAKRQYLDPDRFGVPITHSYVLEGHLAVAVSLLVCDWASLTIGPPAGWWHGDRIHVVGDSEAPDLRGIATAAKLAPWRNLYAMASDEFEDLSLPALAMLLARREGFADELAEAAARNPIEGRSLLLGLGDILRSEPLRDRIDLGPGCDPEALELALARHVGPDWEAKYLGLIAEAGRRRDWDA
jgi:hypothetical protein